LMILPSCLAALPMMSSVLGVQSRFEGGTGNLHCTLAIKVAPWEVA
jgi:hypothetical protein